MVWLGIVRRQQEAAGYKEGREFQRQQEAVGKEYFEDSEMPPDTKGDDRLETVRRLGTVRSCREGIAWFKTVSDRESRS